LDATIRQRFAALHLQLEAGSLAIPATPRGQLAALIVLDQFSRNLYRGTARAFASDAPALALAQHAIAHGFDRELEVRQRLFVYLPFEHSEELSMQVRSQELFQRLADADLLSHAQQHYEIIARFGRFPHRNAILNRPSTAAEREFLLTRPGF
jgi:uncharacterized protein (DUF924 family)